MKRELFEKAVVPTATYLAETCGIKEGERHKFNLMEMESIRTSWVRLRTVLKAVNGVKYGVNMIRLKRVLRKFAPKTRTCS